MIEKIDLVLALKKASPKQKDRIEQAQKLIREMERVGVKPVSGGYGLSRPLAGDQRRVKHRVNRRSGRPAPQVPTHDP